MCGLAGIFRFDDAKPDFDRLRAMQRQVLNRGPDGHGHVIEGRCALAHTRLAVIDPAGGEQPMTRERDAHGPGLAVVFNGEIYNHRKLRRELETLGHRFRSDHSDTEVLLHGYRAWGTALPGRLNGMFAFAIHDRQRQCLLLARDHAGKKPLYAHRDAQRVIFASTVGAIVAGLESTPEIDQFALDHFLTFGYTNDRAIVQGVEELPAGWWRLIHHDGTTEETAFWSPPDPDDLTPPVEPFEAVRKALRKAVVRRLEADVPLGCFLSGGVDSSTIAAIAQDRLRSRGGRLQTFSVAMPDVRYDESQWARYAAQHLGTEHHELVAEPHFEDDLRRLIASAGEPFGDSSVLPTYWVSQAAREHVTVVLSGDGGDELFAGYDRYRAMRMIGRHRWWLRLVPTRLFGRGEQKSFGARLCRLVEAAEPADAAAQYLSIIRLFGRDKLDALGVHGPIIDAAIDWPHTPDPADAARRWDFTRYLPYDLLRKVDRASMAVALEVRCPMLDRNLCDLALRLSTRQLMPRGRAKAMLRRIAADRLPAEITQRRKMGFAVPIAGWFRKELRPLLTGRLLDATALTDLGYRRDTLEKMIAQHASAKLNHAHRLFALLNLSMWLDWLRDTRRS